MPLQIKKYTAADYIQQSWKDGKGATSELVRDIEPIYRWRLSRAHINSSRAFSLFPGYDRVLVTLGHETVWILHTGGKKRVLPSLTPYTFSGDSHTTVEIQAPVEDFNLIYLRGKAEGRVYPTYFRSSKEMQLPIAGQEHFIYCLEGGLQFYEQHSQMELNLEKGELVRVSRHDKKEYLNLKAIGRTTDSIALWIVIHLA